MGKAEHATRINCVTEKRNEKREKEKNKASHKIQNIKSRNRCIDLIVANNNSPKSEQYNKIRNATKRIYLASALASFSLLAIRDGTNQKIKRSGKKTETKQTDTTTQNRRAKLSVLRSQACQKTLLTNKIPKVINISVCCCCCFCHLHRSIVAVYLWKKEREHNFGILLYCNYYR